MKMRILEINDYIDRIGGAEVICNRTIELLSKDNDVYSLSFDNKKSGEKNIFIPQKNASLLNRYLFNPFLYKQIRKEIMRIEPDIIHLHNINEAPITILYACKGYKVIQTVHSYGVLCPTSWSVYKKDYKICDGASGLKCFGHGCIPLKLKIPFIGYLSWFKLLQKIKKKRIYGFITPSKRLKEWMDNNGFNNVINISNPITFERYKKFDDKYLKKSFDNKKILYVGGISKLKGVDKAYNELKKLSSEYKVNIIGNGPLLEKLKERKNISLLGSIPHDKLEKYYEDASIVIVPSVWMDNFPTVILEACSYGKPVIGSDRGGIPEMVDDNDLIFSDFKQINKKIIGLFDDYEKYSKTAKRNYGFSDKFSQDKYKKEIMRFFN
ncbi:hypothetical protein C0585_07570 [Candidatus Woesearchaeota archaeon]|nr:MAG: hypothetical protein C0585_07570 [Candidatus Woesearchaeota archaeon]